MPAGYVTEGNEQYLVRVGDEVTSKADLENLVLMDLGMDGIEPVRLSDVADIEYIDNSGDSYSKVNGNPAVMLSIEKQTGYSTGDVTDRLLDKFDSLEKILYYKSDNQICSDEDCIRDFLNEAPKKQNRNFILFLWKLTGKRRAV